MAQNGTVSRNQQRAIAALMVHRKVADAAEAVGIGERTLKRWLAEDVLFQDELRKAEGQAIDAAARQLLLLQDAAITVMVQILVNGAAAPSVRLKAAQSVIDNLMELRESRDFERRIERLEGVFGARTS